MLNQNMETFFFSLPSTIKMRNTDGFLAKRSLKTQISKSRYTVSNG